MSVLDRYNIVSAYINNQTEAGWQQLLEQIGGAIPIQREPFTVEQLHRLNDTPVPGRMQADGDITVLLSIPFEELACVSTDGTIDGLNEWVDNLLFSKVPCVGSDYRYRAVAVHNDEVIFEFTCDVSDIFNEIEDEDED